LTKLKDNKTLFNKINNQFLVTTRLFTWQIFPSLRHQGAKASTLGFLPEPLSGIYIVIAKKLMLEATFTLIPWVRLKSGNSIDIYARVFRNNLFVNHGI